MIGDPGSPELVVASRGSALALWQAEHVRAALSGADPTTLTRIEVIRTTGDRVLDVPLARIGDRGLFTKELDEALLDGRAHLAVHSLKDVPTRLPAGLVIGAVTQREDPRDVLLSRVAGLASLEALPRAARIGTSSLRRRAQLRALRPDLEVVDLRGNLNTRIAKLDAGDYDAIVLAAAGVRRLGMEDRISVFLAPDRFVPAVGQGALAVVCRADDESTLARLALLEHEATRRCVVAERTLLRELEGGCQVPIAAHATSSGGEIHLDALVADLDGQTCVRAKASGGDAEQLGQRVAETLRAQGADRILAGVRAAFGASDRPDVTLT